MVSSSTGRGERERCPCLKEGGGGDGTGLRELGGRCNCDKLTKDWGTWIVVVCRLYG